MEEEANFYSTWSPEEGESFEYELAKNKHALEENKRRLQCLRDRDATLRLVRDGETHLYEEYEQVFLEKICKLEADVAAIERRL